jgi:DNA repair protein RadD
MKLRPYQIEAKRQINERWREGHRVVCLRMPTGGGKTPTFASVMADEPGVSVAIAHRSELVSQSSLAMAKYGLRHKVIGPKSLAKLCTILQLAEFGNNYVDPNAKSAVAGVNTLVKRNEPWFGQTKLWVIDEFHHCLKDNMWGKAVNLFPHALGLGVTATPGRADGKGLGRIADGYADVMVHGPEMSDLINTGYLSKYKIYCPPSDVDISNVHITAGGEFNQQELSSAIHASRTIVGDAVRHYLERAAGKLGISFTVDVAAATELAAAYRQAGVPAEVITGKTPPLLRADIMRRFRRREILQLTNVGIVGEGVDVPAVECVSMLCHHNSFNLYAQEFGRMLRLLLPDNIASNWNTYTDEFRLRYLAQSDKPYGILFDHVGNVLRHGGPPDVPRVWTLDRRNKRSSGPSDVIPYRICANPECVQPYERIHKCCPHCGFYPEPVSRSAPEFVDGDLLELDERTLAAMRGEIARIDGDPVIPWGATPIVEGAVRKRHWERQQAQSDLRNALAWWAGLQDSQGLTESQSYRRFYHKFGVDVAGAQTLGSREAGELAEKINRELTTNGIDGTVNAEAYFANEQNS